MNSHTTDAPTGATSQHASRSTLAQVRRRVAVTNVRECLALARGAFDDLYLTAADAALPDDDRAFGGHAASLRKQALDVIANLCAAERALNEVSR